METRYMEILGIFLGRILVALVVVAAVLGARWMVAALASIPQAYLPFRRFNVPAAGIPRWTRPFMICAGAIAAYLMASLFFAIGYYMSPRGVIAYDGTVNIVENGPADRVGVRNGDRIVRIAGHPVHTWQDIKTHLDDRQSERSTEIVLERAGIERILIINRRPWEKETHLGLRPGSYIVDANLGQSILFGLRSPGWTVYSLVDYLTREPSNELRGPVSINRVEVPENVLGKGLMFIGYLSLLPGILAALVGAFGWRPIRAQQVPVQPS